MTELLGVTNVFYLVSRKSVRKVLSCRTEWIKFGAEIINNIKVVDDTAILAESYENLQTVVNIVNATCRHKNLTINMVKTKEMVV